MADNRTRPTDAPVEGFLAGVEHPIRRADGQRLLAMMRDVTGEPAVMWGPSIVGFGRHHYRYETGREGDAAAVGFSPRKSSLSIYGLTASPEAPALLARLGTFTTGAACLYVKRLDDVDRDVLEELIRAGYRHATTVLDQPSKRP